jgi:cyanophycinase
MLYDTKRKPATGSVQIAAGLGFMRRAVIDQHFSERLRLSRLLNIVAQHPYLLGCGIDEDAALIVEPGAGLEVIGDGAVTILDGREMLTRVIDEARTERFQVANVRLAGADANEAVEEVVQ